MKKFDYSKPLLIIALVCVAFAGCSKMDDSYRGFVKDGEITYPGKADSVKVFPGKNRIKLSWLLFSDPSIRKCIVFWNNRQDSLEIPVQGSSGTDTVNVIVDKLEEGSYSFEIYSYDGKGRASVKTETEGRVYGEAYIASLPDRLVKSALLENGASRVEWGDSVETSLGTELRYHDDAGVLQTLFVPYGEAVTTWVGYPQGDTLQYRTLFLPVPAALDTFYTPYRSLTFQPPAP
ncbi:DUF4998 domain-containing protein [Compostibacter hankyongensis]|uniref:DUF4998 domain-containing protein n=1 Tax=Compostibacter hankyongensis TaxID=1007089 RepID=A0ABP8FVH8_9BACT